MNISTLWARLCPHPTYYLRIDSHTVRIARLQYQAGTATIAASHIKKSTPPLIDKNRLFGPILIRKLVDHFVPVADRTPRCILVSIPPLDATTPHHHLLVQLLCILQGLGLTPSTITPQKLFAGKDVSLTKKQRNALPCLVKTMLPPPRRWPWILFGLCIPFFLASIAYTWWPQQTPPPSRTNITAYKSAPKPLHSWPWYTIATALPREIQVTALKHTKKEIQLTLSCTTPDLLNNATRRLYHALPLYKIKHTSYRFCFGAPPLYEVRVQVYRRT